MVLGTPAQCPPPTATGPLGQPLPGALSPWPHLPLPPLPPPRWKGPTTSSWASGRLNRERQQSSSSREAKCTEVRCFQEAASDSCFVRGPTWVLGSPGGERSCVNQSPPRAEGSQESRAKGHGAGLGPRMDHPNLHACVQSLLAGAGPTVPRERYTSWSVQTGERQACPEALHTPHRAKCCTLVPGNTAGPRSNVRGSGNIGEPKSYWS